MEQLVILVIWLIGNIIIKSSKEKNVSRAKQHGKKTRSAHSRGMNVGSPKKVFDNLKIEIEKELQRERDLHRERELEREKKKQQEIESQWMETNLYQVPEPSISSQPLPPPKPPKPIKPKGLVVDRIGGNEEMGAISKSDTPLEVEYINKLGLDLKRDLLKGIIYAEILSEPKSMKNIKRSC